MKWEFQKVLLHVQDGQNNKHLDPICVEERHRGGKKEQKKKKEEKKEITNARCSPQTRLAVRRKIQKGKAGKRQELRLQAHESQNKKRTAGGSRQNAADERDKPATDEKTKRSDKANSWTRQHSALSLWRYCLLTVCFGSPVCSFLVMC